MWIELETVRSLVWRAAWSADHDPGWDPRLGSAAKTQAASAGVRVCLAASEILGGRATLDDAGVAARLADAVSLLHSDGAQDTHRLRVGRMIRGDALE
jgi:alkylation response protein AidB-like acyl-CoA dehydrogenase